MSITTAVLCLLPVAALCVSAPAQGDALPHPGLAVPEGDSPTTRARPLVLGHGVGRSRVGQLQAEDDFVDLQNCVIQVQPRPVSA